MRLFRCGRLAPWQQRAFLAGLLVVALLALSLGVGAAPAPVGNTTYYINGQETILTFDPMSKGRALVLPEEVLQKLGLTLLVRGRDITLTRDKVEVKMVLGATVIEAEDGASFLPATPLRQSGRMYIPADALNYLGYEWTGDNLSLEIRDLTSGSLPTITRLSDKQYTELKAKRSLEASLRLDGLYVPVTITLLTPELITDIRLPASAVERARALKLLESFTLVNVEVRNDQIKAVTFSPELLFLVDAQGMPLEYQAQMVGVQGTLSTRVGPKANKSSMLVYPKLLANATTVGVFFDSGNHWVGTIVL